ncbi:hypothetical protein FQN55_005246 [Onygenales sp. PD_40]|nr:hypothetical protein FQN55_005246 [Onygenales sp. PD_40]
MAAGLSGDFHPPYHWKPVKEQPSRAKKFFNIERAEFTFGRAWALFPSIESTLLRSAGDYHIDNLVNNIEDSDIIQVFLGNDAPESETAVAAVAEDMASVRQTFIENWLQKQEIHTGRQNCPLSPVLVHSDPIEY